jgi:hypothetical protein
MQTSFTFLFCCLILFQFWFFSFGIVYLVKWYSSINTLFPFYGGSMRKYFARLPKAVQIILSFVAITIFLPLLNHLADAALQGIVGDAAVSLFHTLWNTILTPQNTPILLIVLFSLLIILMILYISTLVYHHHKAHELEQEHRREQMQYQTQRDLLILTETLMRLIPGLLIVGDEEATKEALRLLIERLIVQAISILSDDVFSASFFIPDASGEILRIWASHQVAINNSGTAQCYIGKHLQPGMKRGVAGEAFDRQSIIIARQTGKRNQDGSWKFDRDSFIDFIGGNTSPPFSAIACVALVNDEQISQGVICFDSRQKDTFDSSEIQERLRLIGRCFTAVLIIYQEITHHSLTC